MAPTPQATPAPAAWTCADRVDRLGFVVAGRPDRRRRGRGGDHAGRAGVGLRPAGLARGTGLNGLFPVYVSMLATTTVWAAGALTAGVVGRGRISSRAADRPLCAPESRSHAETSNLPSRRASTRVSSVRRPVYGIQASGALRKFSFCWARRSRASSWSAVKSSLSSSRHWSRTSSISTAGRRIANCSRSRSAR